MNPLRRSIDLAGAAAAVALRLGMIHGQLLRDVEAEIGAWTATRERVGALPDVSNFFPRSTVARRIDARSNRLYERCSRAIAQLEAIQSELFLSQPKEPTDE